MLRGRNTLRVSTTVPICEIGNDTNNNGLLLQGAGTAAAFTATVCDVTPYDFSLSAIATGSTPTGKQGSWISPHVPLLALAFDRYVMSSVTFHYEPQSAATVADRLIFAWTDDPCHPFLSASQTVGGTLPSQLELLVTQDSVAFMPWKDWSLKVPVSKDERFMYDLADASQNTSRFYDFGSMSCVGSAGPSATIYGVLYISMVIDFFDPVPIVSSVKTLVTELHARKRYHRRYVDAKAAKIPVFNRFAPLATDEDADPTEGKGELFVKPSAHDHLPPNSPKLVRTSRWYGDSVDTSKWFSDTRYDMGIKEDDPRIQYIEVDNPDDADPADYVPHKKYEQFVRFVPRAKPLASSAPSTSSLTSSAGPAPSVPSTPSLSSRPASSTASLPVTNPPKGTLKAL
jgi:hypothetical protein